MALLTRSTHKLASAAAIVTIVIVCACPAHADPDSDFLQYLQSGAGKPIPAELVPDFLHAGHTICADLKSGLVTRQQEARDFHDEAVPHANYAQVAYFIDAAQRTLCPETIGKVG
jgi:hypothetical protein